jgi:hypothetical protein
MKADDKQRLLHYGVHTHRRQTTLLIPSLLNSILLHKIRIFIKDPFNTVRGHAVA